MLGLLPSAAIGGGGSSSSNGGGGGGGCGGSSGSGELTASADDPGGLHGSRSYKSSPEHQSCVTPLAGEGDRVETCAAGDRAPASMVAPPAMSHAETAGQAPDRTGTATAGVGASALAGLPGGIASSLSYYESQYGNPAGASGGTVAAGEAGGAGGVAVGLDGGRADAGAAGTGDVGGTMPSGGGAGHGEENGQYVCVCNNHIPPCDVAVSHSCLCISCASGTLNRCSVE